VKTGRNVKAALAPLPAAGDEGMAPGWGRFWFTPTPPISLHLVRFFAGMLFIFWLLPFAGDLDSLFGLQGWFDQEAYVRGLERPTRTPEAGGNENRGLLEPMIGWSLLYFRSVGGNSQVLATFYWSAIGIFALFALGIASRITGVLTWLAVVSFTANPALSYDGDGYLVVLAFYLMIGYLLIGQRTRDLSWTGRLFGSWKGDVVPSLFSRSAAPDRPSMGANLALRLLQVHFAIIMVMSGLHKLQFGDWWGGYALWYPLYPAGQTTMLQARAHATTPDDARQYMVLLSLAAYAVLFWQIGFALFAWRQRWRPVLLIGGAIGWLADSFLYELPLMGPALFIGCLAFVTADQWQRLFALLSRVPGLRWASPAPAGEPAWTVGTLRVEKEEPSNCITVGHP